MSSRVFITIDNHNYKQKHEQTDSKVNDMHTFFDSSDTNIVFLSVPITILSLANSNCLLVNLSAPSTAAFMAAMLTKFARSDQT